MMQGIGSHQVTPRAGAGGEDFSASPTLVAAAFAVLIGTVAWPRDPESVGFAFTMLFASVNAACFYVALRRRALLTALFVALIALTQGAALGDAVQVGIERNGNFASTGSVQFAVLLVLGFVVVTVATSLLTQRRARDLRRATGPKSPRAFVAGVMVFFAACALSAFTTNTWTQWGGRSMEAVASGGFRLELMYPSMLFVGVGLMVLPSAWSSPRQLRPALRIMMGLAFAILIFALQSRRIMFSCGILVALSALMYPRNKPAVATAANGRRVAGVSASWTFRIVALGGALALGLVASSGWRAAAGKGAVGFSSGIGAAVSATFSSSEFDSSVVEDRLTYLWLDSMTVELEKRGGLELDVVKAFESSFLMALPSVFYADKSMVQQETCESAFSKMGVDTDLPCTPTSEAYTGLGIFGVLLVSLLWGLYIGGADYAVRRWSSMGRLLGLSVFAPSIAIEVGLFPMIQGVRGAVIAFGCVAIAAAIFRFLGQHPRDHRHSAQQGTDAASHGRM